MCGVLGLICERERDDLGQVAAMLLRTLEYRGYDSTGAAIQGPGTDVVLRKGVGAPSKLVESLGITGLGGSLFCGQVRWATFGAITAENAQPHVVRCKTFLYGAHNGNVTNCDPQKAWLEAEGHHVRSDNDGEMVVHTIEHEFARELAALSAIGGANAGDHAARRAAMRRAISGGARRLQGSYAAVIVDPVSRVQWAIKQGSSLYFGFGKDETGGHFGLASSDLSSVLKLTHLLVPLREGDFVEYDALGHAVYSVADARPIERPAVRSRLRAGDTALDPRFATFMEQEIAAQPATVRSLVAQMDGGGQDARKVAAALAGLGEEIPARLHEGIEALRRAVTDEGFEADLARLLAAPELGALARAARLDAAATAEEDAAALASADAGLFVDLMPHRAGSERASLRLLDALLQRDEAAELATAADRFVTLAAEAARKGGRLLVVSCGSSYNAARTAALFFSELSRTELVPLLPGEYRERIARTLRAEDVVVAISQSGETKDLVDILDDVHAAGLGVRCVALVNNVNSTIAQEKAEVVVPLRCGPEIAVPATKSFLAQLVVMYLLALRLGERRLAEGAPDRDGWAADLAARRAGLDALPALLERTERETAATIDEAASLLYLRPSMHLLAMRLSGLAREGALKIREIVLDHAEGFEGSEFKHGPNTILGWNTLLGPDQLAHLLARLAEAGVDLRTQAAALAPETTTPPAGALLGQALADALRVDYPLLFLTGPDERDVHLTISQINTHKIRGATTIVVAEEHAGLRQAAEKAPADNPGYRAVYVPLPRTGDALLVAFSATVALQRLALRMSVLKSSYLDARGIPEHGVHPDVPKNVSKSITVD